MLFTNGKTDCSPAEVGYNEQRLEVLNNHIQSLMDQNEIHGGTYCISRKGRVFAHGAVGYKNHAKEPLSPTDVRYIASVTKVFTAVAIMKLVEDGKVRLDTPVGSILPEFDSAPFDTINIFHLLTHTSGMHADGGCFPNKHNDGSYWHFIEVAYEAHKAKNDKADKPTKAAKGEKAKETAKKPEFDWLSAALAYGVSMKPDTQWMYCSFGFTVIGEIIRKISGVHAHEFIEQAICRPLGLNDTAFTLNKDTARRFMNYDKKDDKWLKTIQDGKPPKRDEPWDSMPNTGGGLFGTAQDMARFGNMALYGGSFDGIRILGRKCIEKMTKIQTALPDFCWNPAGGAPRKYGIGFDHRYGAQFIFGENTFMHEGAGACSLYIDPDEELVAAWIVPFTDNKNWYHRAQFNTANIIWSGL